MEHFYKKLSLSVFGTLMIIVSLCITGCKEEHPLVYKFEINHNLQGRIEVAKSSEEILPYIDSLRQEEIISEAEAELFRGYAYNFVDRRDDLARDHFKNAYYQFCTETNPTSDLFAEAAFRSANYEMSVGNLDEGCRMVTNALYKLEDKEDFSEHWRSNLYMLLANFHYSLGMFEETKQMYEKSYQSKVKVLQQVSATANDIVLLCILATEVSIATRDFEKTEIWRNRTEDLVKDYEATFKAEQKYEVFREYLAISRLHELAVKGEQAEAAQRYKTTPHEVLAHTYGLGNIICGFLEDAGLYKEAADQFNRIDSLYQNIPQGKDLTFITVAQVLAPRYRVNRKAGRTEMALALADSIYFNSDSIYFRQAREKTATIATIYKMHEKELELKDAQAESRIQRILLCATGLIILLIGYLFVRSHQHNKELRAKNRSLFEQIQKREQEEQYVLNTLQAQPEEALTSEQRLYRRLCTLMAEKQPYTNEELNRETLAKMLDTNSKYVVDAIRECSHGETVTDFITRYRLEHVARLLKTTDEPVNLIGEMSGIPSRTTLSRLFRNTYGMTCSEYRQAATQR